MQAPAPSAIATLTPVRGRLVCPAADAPHLSIIDDGLVTFDADGRIASVGPAPAGCAVPETAPGAVWLPGFVDTHVHHPQTRIIGSATGPLLDWLAQSVFPEEARLADAAYAAAVTDEFCDALIAHGTTTAVVYGSSLPSATDQLFAALAARGLRADVGLTLMDRDSPDGVRVPADVAQAASEQLIARWHGHDGGRLRFVVTPRFALSCTRRQMRDAGDLAERHGLWVQTHIAENTAELAAVAAEFPEAADYLAVYADHGLAGPRTVLAHCIWFDDAAWDRVAALGCTVSHCPDSNFFLGSGAMDLAAPQARGVRVGLGTDVGAGRSFSLRQTAASAWDAARVRGARADAEGLLWLATAGGAAACGRPEVGRLAPGLAGDLVAIDVPAYVLDRSPQALFEALVFRRDAGPVRHTLVQGRRLR